MSKCCPSRNVKVKAGDPCAPPSCDAGNLPAAPCCHAEKHFAEMIPRCLAHAKAAKAAGRPVVGILCEYTPREVILAAGAVPVCLCGGSADTIADAESVLPANLCPLIKSTFGYHVQKSNPFLEMADLIVAETTCDGKKKMYELLADRKPVHVLELPQKPDDPEALARWTGEVRRLADELGRRSGTKTTDDRLRAAIAEMNRERSLRRQLAELMKADRPPLTGRQLLDFKSSISCIPEDIAAYESALTELSAKAAGAAAPTCGCSDSQPVRVLMTGVPIVHGAERVLEIVENAGGLVVAMENCTGLKPILDDVDASAADPIAAIAEKYYHLPCSVMTPNNARLDLLARLAREYRAQCVVELVWQACLTYDVESARVRRLADERLGLPYLRIETDYSPSDSARIAVRVEALFETVRAG